MSQYFTITLPSNSSPGPYNIYYNFLGNGFLASVYNTPNLAENITLSELITGVTVVVPDNTTIIYLYNSSKCDSAQEFPIPTPTPVYDKLCLSFTCGYINQQYEFSWNGDYYNGKPVFSATGGYNLVWITGSTPNYWEVSGLTSPILRSTDPNIPPSTNWQAYNTLSLCGGNRISVKSTLGACGGQKSLPIIEINKTNPTCYNLNDGGISINVLGGDPPYTYSLDGVNYFPSPIFPGLTSSAYNIFIKDVSGSVVSQPVILTGPPPTNHQMNINQLSFSQIAQVGNIKYYQLNYSITPSIPLPIPSQVFCDLFLEYNLSYSQPGTSIFYTSGNSFTKNITTTSPIPILSTTPLSVNSPSSCNPIYNTFAGQNEYKTSFVYQNGDSLSGTCIFGIDSLTTGSLDGPCFTDASISLNVRTEITAVDCDCCYVIGNTLIKNINVTYFSYI